MCSSFRTAPRASSWQRGKAHAHKSGEAVQSTAPSCAQINEKEKRSHNVNRLKAWWAQEVASIARTEPGLREGRPQGAACVEGKSALSEDALGGCSSVLEEDVSSGLAACHVKKRHGYKAEKRYGTPRRQQNKTEVKQTKGTSIANHNTQKLGEKKSTYDSCRSQFFCSEGLASNQLRVLYLHGPIPVGPALAITAKL